MTIAAPEKTKTEGLTAQQHVEKALPLGDAVRRDIKLLHSTPTTSWFRVNFWECVSDKGIVATHRISSSFFVTVTGTKVDVSEEKPPKK